MASHGSVTIEIRARDEVTPLLGVIRSVQKWSAYAARLAARLHASQQLVERLRWEAEWAALTGRPWGWTPPRRPTRLDITLDPLFPYLSRVRIGDLDIPAEAVSVGVTVDRRQRLTIEVPLAMADVRTSPARG